MEVVESAEEDPMVIFRGIMSSMLGLGKNQVDEAKRLLVQARSALSAMSPTRARQYTSEGRVDGPFGLWANHLVSFVAYNWLTFLTESEKKVLSPIKIFCFGMMYDPESNCVSRYFFNSLSRRVFDKVSVL